MDGKQLRAIEERANRATPGPWEEVAESGEWWVTGPETGVHFVMATNASEGILQANVDFICAARTDVPALIAEIRALRAKLDAVPVYVAGVVGAAPLVSFEDFYTFVTGIGTDTDTSADGLVIPDDGGDE